MFIPQTVSATYRILVFSQPGSNTPPSIGMGGVAGTQRNLVDVSYKLVDPDSDPVTIVVDFSIDSGTTWSPATEGPGGDGTGPLPSGPLGPLHIFQWDSMTDVGPIRVQTVRIRITPSDLVTGTPGETTDFTVDNRPNQLRFTLGGTMVEGRIFHTATVLNSGFVLIAGGMDSTDPALQTVLQTAEIYNPAGDTFVPVPTPMAQPRARHTATLLSDGRVLLAGGVDALKIEHTSAEIFDPTSGMFQPVGSMSDFRAGHTAVSTSAGVFILGGEFLSGIIPVHYDDVEEYDPVANMFLTPLLGPLVEQRSRHDAIELPSGRILLIGGGVGTNLSVEEFDTTLGTGVEQSISASATQVVAHASALLQNGTVLIVGGAPGREIISANNSLDQASVYDPTGPVGSRWTNVGPMSHTRRWHSATTLTDGRVAIIGGQENLLLNSVDEAELYDPAVPALNTSDLMILPRFHHQSVLLQDGRVLITGGTSDGINFVLQSEIFGP